MYQWPIALAGVRDIADMATCGTVAGLTPVQTVELNSVSTKLRDLEKRFEQLVSSRRFEDDRQRQLVELQKQVELIHIPQPGGGRIERCTVQVELIHIPQRGVGGVDWWS